MVEELPEEHNRQRERRREALATAIEQARQELARGEVQRGTVNDLMAESTNEESRSNLPPTPNP
jgi:hypothetical protein